MDCDYCGDRALARWEVTAGDFVGDGMTRYACDSHVDAARGHVAQLGLVVSVLELQPSKGTIREFERP